MQRTKHRVKDENKIARKTKTQDDWDDFVHIRNLLNNKVKKAKREAWHNYCTETSTVKGMSKRIKSVQGIKNNSRGLLKKPDGSYTRDPEETLSLLMDEHFPESSPIGQSGVNNDNNAFTTPPSPAKRLDMREMNSGLFNVPNIKRVLKSFGSLKAAGLDGFPPIVLQQLPDCSLE